MADAVSAYEATLVGDELPGDAKWYGGVLAADGNIYGIPSFVHRAGGKHLVMHLAMHLPSSPPLMHLPSSAHRAGGKHRAQQQRHASRPAYRPPSVLGPGQLVGSGGLLGCRQRETRP